MTSYFAHVSAIVLLGAVAASADPRAVLWQSPEPTRIHSLAYGAGGPNGQPTPPFRFLDEEKSGTKAKVWVRDASGRKWIVKFGKEVRPDIFATRLTWAMGYNAAPIYFIPSGRLAGIDQVSRAAKYVTRDGVFSDGRFKLVDESMTYDGDGWRWDKNPFMLSQQGRQELAGLKILMMLVSNWDGKDPRHWNGSNTAILRAANADYYVMDDWGSSMGEWGHVFDRGRWSCEDFTGQSEKFVKRVDDRGSIKWGFHGTAEEELTKDITLADVQWLNQFLGQLTDEDLLSGLRASGADDSEAACFVRALRIRIDSLKNLAPSQRLAERE